MKILFAVLLLPLSFSAYAEEKDDTDYLVNLMVTAKATGMCGVFGQMARFQASTKMPGGDEFILRFLNTEAARLGHDAASFMEQCPIVIQRYDETMKILGVE